MFTIKDGYKPELKTPETMKLIGSTKKKINSQNKNCRKRTCVEAAEVVLVQYNLMDNQY